MARGWFLLLLLSVPAVSAFGPAYLTLLDTNAFPTARCMDGSPGGFYWRAPLPGFERRWVFSLEGGGECVTEDSCKERTHSELGSSKYFKPTTWLGQLQDGNSTNNPDFHGYAAVFVKYCSGDLHYGQVQRPSDATWGLYFSGHNIIAAVLDTLEQRFNLSLADLVVWSGDSAGGLGAFASVDYVADRMPHSRVVGVPIGGFYFPAHPYTGPGATPYVPFGPSDWPLYQVRWQAYVHPSCAAAYGPSQDWRCLLGKYSFRYTATPMFVVEAQTDRVVMPLHDGLPGSPPFNNEPLLYVQEWSDNMTGALQQVKDSPSAGLFNPACWVHCDFFPNEPLIEGISYLTAIGNWLFNRTGPTKLQDTCGLFCNPTCPPVQSDVAHG